MFCINAVNRTRVQMGFIDRVKTLNECDSCSKKDWFIYVAEVDRFIKIGLSGDVEKRICGIQSHIPYEIKIISKFNIGKKCIAVKVEQMVHSKLKIFSVRGEWYSSQPSFIEIIKRTVSESINEIMQISENFIMEANQ